MVEIYRKTDQPEKAEEYFAIVVKDQPGMEDGHIGLSRTLLELNHRRKRWPQLNERSS